MSGINACHARVTKNALDNVCSVLIIFYLYKYLKAACIKIWTNIGKYFKDLSMDHFIGTTYA